jgi:hypothetical protein
MKWLVVLIVLAGCPGPGEGAKAERGYRASEPVLDALDRHFARTGEYPATLDELLDPADGLAAVPRPNDNDLHYASSGTDFELAFTYTGPGVNHCTTSHTRAWSCHGYY